MGTGEKIFIAGGTYTDYLNATPNIRKDTAVTYYAGDLEISREAYNKEQAAFMKVKDQYEFEPETASLIMVPDFDTLFSSLNIDVLALFGEKDTNVDWRKAKQVYESTIGNNPNASLHTQTFPNANHSLTISPTGSVREVEGNLMREGVKAEGYYRVQLDWLRQYVLNHDY